MAHYSECNHNGDFKFLESIIEIRKNGTVTVVAGYVQYCLNNTWRAICGQPDTWGLEDAQVACRQLGYSESGES